MVATFISVFVLFSSAAMLVFWLRSASRSILAERFEESYSAAVAEANQLEFLAIRRELTESPAAANCSAYLTALERDYEALTYLLRNAATVHIGRYTRRERLLILDFQLLRAWVRLKHAVRGGSWRDSMVEMASILEYFGNVVGQRLASFPVRVPTH